VSRDDGGHWTNVVDRLPGLPESTWINGIEASRHSEGTVYVTINNYRNDDYANYLYRSTDYGESWTSITGDLPPNRALRTLREDLRNPSVLYLGTEFGLFYSNDGGSHWVELESNLPTVAVNDLVIHPRDNDLVLGTHGRGIWILDNINALQELTPEVLASDAHLFTSEPAEMIRYARDKGHTGDMIFRGANPPAGATIDYYLRQDRDSGEVTITIHDAAGNQINELDTQSSAGVHRAVWDLRHPNLSEGGGGGFFGGPVRGPWVQPGEYTARLTVAGRHYEQAITVHEDSRINLSDAERREWHETVVALAETIRSYSPTVDAVSGIKERLDEMSDAEKRQHRSLAAEIEETEPLATELRRRLRSVYSQINGWPGRPTADQQSQIRYFQDWLGRLQPRLQRIMEQGGEVN
jgi:hypothetical protein